MHVTNFTSTGRNWAEPPLLRLPAELRNAVYRFVLETADLVADDKPAMTLQRSDLRLPRVCRQIHDETRALVGMYGTVRLRCTWSSYDVFGVVELLQRPSNRLRLSAVRQLELSPFVAANIQRETLIHHFAIGGAAAGRIDYREALSQTFQSLEKVVLPREATTEVTEKESYRYWFKNPNLEVVYTDGQESGE
jgi:hypothetical protein